MSDREARRWFELAFESSPTVMLLVGPTGAIHFANPATQQVFGHAEHELTGLDVGVLVAPASRPKLRKLRARYEVEGRRRPLRADLELSGIHRSGREFPIAVGLGLVRSGNSALVLVSVVDITRRKRSEARIRGDNEALRAAVARQNETLAARNRELEAEVRARGEIEAALRETQRQLEDANEHLRRLAHEDVLTGLANRREFEARLRAEYRRAARSRRPLAVVLFDLDHFKALNDAAGHGAGDECLRRVAAALDGCLHRAGDMVARLGGEEFAALLPDTPRPGGARIAAQMCAAVRALAIPHPASPRGIVTISAGVAAAIPDATAEAGSLLDAADRAMYAAKTRGRDRVCIALPADRAGRAREAGA